MKNQHPNIIFVLTDDQGYGDLGYTGNPWIMTPYLNQFAQVSVRCHNFHVSPLCTPTRGTLMTGRSPLRHGAWATAWGRSLLRREEITLPSLLANYGYVTGIFGKWHLGDHYPYRPQHQLFFCYIATNAPHSPYFVSEDYASPYRNNPNIPSPEFYGMITNIDQNFGKLRNRIQELGLEENTILIFMTDNGTSGGWDPQRQLGFNAGMRGIKGSYYEGGHRVPFFIYWPKGGLYNRDIFDLLDHTDFFPTLCSLCSIPLPPSLEFDGYDISSILKGSPPSPEIKNRIIYLTYRQSFEPPDPWDNLIMSTEWRLIRGKELYHIQKDPGQTQNVIKVHPDIVQFLCDRYLEWRQKVDASGLLPEPFYLGTPEENPTCLNAMDVLGDIAWNQPHIRQAVRSCGRWRVKISQRGKYRFSLYRWHPICSTPINEKIPSLSIPKELQSSSYTEIHSFFKEIRSIEATSATFKIGNHQTTLPIQNKANFVSFVVDLAPSELYMEAFFNLSDGTTLGAYYVIVELLN
ncbi:MAG: sulfatase-like hydrolase/transferase [Candidatus Bathyarchaeia archaeon]